MSDLLSKFQSAYSSSDDDDEDNQPSAGMAKPNIPQNNSTKNLEEKSSTSKLGTDNNLLSNLSNATRADQKQVEKKFLGKRIVHSSDIKDEEDSEEEFDLMNQARKNINQRNAQELIIKKQKQQNDNNINEDLSEKKLQHIDPSTQKLFSMLPPPKKSDQQTISSALRSEGTEIQFIEANDDEEDDNEQRLEKDLPEGQVVDIKSGDQINKEDFYRNQLKKLSIQKFKEQSLARMRKYDESGDLTQKGKSKNQLISLGSEHIDMITELQDNQSNNLNEFRSKRARYGW